jgi:CheY-like chemotaxis protein
MGFAALVRREDTAEGRAGEIRMVDLVQTETLAERVLRVLVVDDNRPAADSLSVLLRTWGYECRVAYDGRSGLEAACAHRPDCLVLDINMPGMNGYALAARVRGQPGLEKVKLIALTAYSDHEHVERAKEAGFEHYFVKPADPDELGRLLDMMNEVIRLATRTEELARRNVELATEAKELLQDVKQDIREVKEELREVKEQLREVRDAGPGDREEDE